MVGDKVVRQRVAERHPAHLVRKDEEGREVVGRGYLAGRREVEVLLGEVLAANEDATALQLVGELGYGDEGVLLFGRGKRGGE